MRKWYQRSRKRGWVERRRRFRRIFTAADKRRELAIAQELGKMRVEKDSTE